MSGSNSTRTDVSVILSLCRGIVSLICILILSPARGFVFCAIRNIQAPPPIENILAMP